MPLAPLPIDPLRSDLLASLENFPSLVLEAPPGAGKTTRVPRWLLDAQTSWLGDREIVILEPRRLAARLAAKRVAEELGEAVGDRVGYQVRFEEVASAATRVRFVTEGVLTRQLGRSGALDRVGVVLLDEFHERHLQGDIALALLTQLQRTTRPDLRVIVMSATLEAGAIASFLNAPILRSEGRRFDVVIDHLAAPDDRHLDKQVASAVRRLVREGLDGHVLVFLPGAADIRRSMDTCGAIASEAGLSLHALHGDLPPAEQDRAIAPSTTRKVILSTNVAESSVTIEGVAAVVDCGLARVITHSPWTGLSALTTQRISRASATQRAGRAGRTREGRCLRLYTEHEFTAMPAHDSPEITRVDLSEMLLALASQAISPAELPWLDAPPPPAVASANELLERLGAIRPSQAIDTSAAIGERGETKKSIADTSRTPSNAIDSTSKITAIGERMLRLPLHPRLSRLVVEGEHRDVLDGACLVAALLSERDIRRASRASFDTHAGAGGAPRSGGASAGRDAAASSDVIDRLEAFRLAASERFHEGALRDLGLDGGAVRAVDRAWKQLRRTARVRRDDDERDDSAVLERCLLAAFPDRVARRREPGRREVVLTTGAAVLAENSIVHSAPFMIAVDAEVRPRRGHERETVSVRMASAIEPEWLLEQFPDRIRDTVEVTWNATAERVEVWQRMLYDTVVLDENRSTRGAEIEVAALLAKVALARGLSAFTSDPDALDLWLQRARFVASLDPTFPALGDGDLQTRLASLCEGKSSFRELREIDIRLALEGSLEPARLQQLMRWAPERIELKNGRRAQVSYVAGQAPWVESYLQDFFGMTDGPSMADGRVKVVLHLLAPNKRAVQVTTDLAGFWKTHYPTIRKELSRRYPRHKWPESPL